MFPGQGTQFVGMGAKLLENDENDIVRNMFDRASAILNYDLMELCLEGPQEQLDRTIHCQPAVFVTSLAAVEKLYMANPEYITRAVATAGFSVGELSALVFGGALSFKDGLK